MQQFKLLIIHGLIWAETALHQRADKPCGVGVRGLCGVDGCRR
jgi:hypothetical protein